LNDHLVYCVKWGGCTTALGHVIDEKYEWEKPSRELSEMIAVYEQLGPAITYNEEIEVLHQFQHINQEPIKECELKDLSSYPKIELFVDEKKYEFYELPKRFQYKGVWRTLRYPYFMSRNGIIWNNGVGLK